MAMFNTDAVNYNLCLTTYTQLLTDNYILLVFSPFEILLTVLSSMLLIAACRSTSGKLLPSSSAWRLTFRCWFLKLFIFQHKEHDSEEVRWPLQRHLPRNLRSVNTNHIIFCDFAWPWPWSLHSGNTWRSLRRRASGTNTVSSMTWLRRRWSRKVASCGLARTTTVTFSPTQLRKVRTHQPKSLYCATFLHSANRLS